MTEQKGQTQPSKTKWPDAAPLDGEELLFSISCGNSHLHWATHYGDAEDYNPQIFWRTPHLKEEDMENEDLLAILSRNLPDDPHDHIFGKSVDATKADAEAQSKKRAAPLISVYVVSTNRGQEALLAKIWKTVPSRFFVMQGEDFFKKEEGRYDTMGTDRLATLTGAVHLHGHPALVFDGGTATTYSATDGDGKILGGGIGPGIQSKFRSLTKDTDALPEITTEEVIARVNEAQEKGKPLPTFARNTQEAMMADAFQEFALKGRNVIEHWLEKSYGKSNDDEKEISPTRKFNSEKRVICTGGDGDILMQLLQPHYGGVIEHMESNGANGGGGGGGGGRSKNGALAPRYVVEASKHLIHYGIACVLAAQVGLGKSKEAFRKNPHLEEHVGKRVAKHFEVEADDGDNIYRGKVMEIVEVEGKDHEFRIKYDDGDSEDVTSGELFDMLKLFSVHGEKKKKAPLAKGKKKPAAKRARKGKSSDDEKAEEVPAKSAWIKATVTVLEETKADGKASKRIKSSEHVERAVDIPRLAKSKAKEAPLEEEKAIGKNDGKLPTEANEPAAKKAQKEQATEDEKTMEPKEPAAKKAKKASDDEKPAAVPAEEKKPAAKKAEKAKPSAGGKEAPEEEEKKPAAKRGEKAKPSDADKVAETPSVSARSAKKKAGRTPPSSKKSSAKKAKGAGGIVGLVNSSDPRSFVRRRIAKDFDGELYFGTIMEYDDSETPVYWHVEYDDGDEEDYSKKDLIKALKYYEVKGKQDANKGK
eukprot:CAMPEP_0172538208 /NCGR_PEP_ID=MMETSP1067-20121228/9646_1 /TAXON_ID=265564 ORGANISM="Thalassiosira punctigera, Strain Tpunct2005C2" /NCGR_SAMPLE_ID=MMETSP1067 /ASSEMBLY_ACC=CAM_ASM_000444 /LENGTH=758 /DNA_ID=CAMNT_0013323661 /DNA_START=132 /DNA_END=2408 /DNA_ORIENTATION=+